MKKAAGFTLIELMLVVGLAAVLLTLGIPGIQQLLQNSARSSAANEVVAALQRARSEAIKRNTIVTLCPSSDGASCTGGTAWEDGWIAFIDDNLNGVDEASDKDGNLDAGEELFQTGDALDGPTLRTSFAGLQYRSNGRMRTLAGNDEAEFILCDGRGPSESRVVLIYRSGRTQVSGTDLTNNQPATCTP